jgi:hypothetical protein
MSSRRKKKVAAATFFGGKMYPILFLKIQFPCYAKRVFNFSIFSSTKGVLKFHVNSAFIRQTAVDFVYFFLTLHFQGEENIVSSFNRIFSNVSDIIKGKGPFLNWA